MQKSFMKKTVGINALVWLFMLVFSDLHSQNKNFNTENTLWSKGQIYTAKGSISGELNYNFVNDILRLKRKDGTIKSIIANSIQGFILKDSLEDKRFISTPFDIEGRGRKKKVFFQVIHVDGQYAVLSKHFATYSKSTPQTHPPSPSTPNANDPFSALQNTNSLTPTPPEYSLIHEKVIQIIYLVDMNDLTVLPVLEKKKSIDSSIFEIYGLRVKKNQEEKFESSRTSLDGKKFRKSRKHKNDSNHLGFSSREKLDFKDFFKNDYKAFKAYVEEQSLDPKTLEGLVAALAFKN